MSYALIFKFELFFAFPFGTILYQKLIIFLPTGLATSTSKDATGNTLSNVIGKEDFPATNVSGTCRDWQPTIEPRRNNNQAFGMECVRGTVARS